MTTNEITLDYLKESETIRLVIEGKYTPKELDMIIRNMKKHMRELEHTHQLDIAEVVNLRRRIELLMEMKE